MREGVQQPSGLLRLFYGLALATLILFIAHVGASILVPLVIAVFLTFLIVTLKDFILRAPLIGKFLPAPLGFLIAFLVIAGALLVFIEIVRTNIDSIIREAPAYQQRLNDLVEQMRAVVPGLSDLNTLWSEIRQNVRISSLFSEVADPLRTLGANIVTIFLYTGFLLVERGAISKKIAALTSTAEQRDKVNATIDDIAMRVRQYVSIKTFVSAILGAVSYGILLLIGVDHASFWALLIFALNFIPIVGSIVAVAFPVALTLLQFGDLGRFVLALVSLTAAQMTMGNIIEPRLFGSSLNLSPLVILLSLAVWGTIWGVAGMLLCIPIMVIVMITLAQFESTRPAAILLSADGRVGSKSFSGDG